MNKSEQLLNLFEANFYIKDKVLYGMKSKTKVGDVDKTDDKFVYYITPKGAQRVNKKLVKVIKGESNS